MTAYSDISQVPLFKYGMVMADPPWKHEMWSEKGEERSPSQHYRTMSLDQVKRLPVGDLCQPNALIWLWAPGCFVNIAESVLNSWGAVFVSSGFWTKTQLHAPSKPKMGTGYWHREAGEPWYLGKIGKPAINDRGIPNAILEPRREHSRKPEQGYQYAERMVPTHMPKLDLFSRQERDGWDCMGDEHDKFTDNTGRCGQADWKERNKVKKNGRGKPDPTPSRTIGQDEIQHAIADPNQPSFILD